MDGLVVEMTVPGDRQYYDTGIDLGDPTSSDTHAIQFHLKVCEDGYVAMHTTFGSSYAHAGVYGIFIGGYENSISGITYV